MSKHMPSWGTPDEHDDDASQERARDARRDEFGALGLPERGPVFEGVDAAAAQRGVVVPLPPRTGPGDTDDSDSVEVEPEAVEVDPEADADADAQGEPGRVLVDSVAAQRRKRLSLAGLKDGRRRPILPSWAKDRREAVGNATWLVGLAGHTVAYHGLRAPKYATKVLLWAPRGAVRFTSSYGRWLSDMEGEPVRQAVVRAAATRPEEAKTYERLSRQRDRRVRWRGIVTATLAVVGLVALVLVFFLPTWALYCLAAGIVVALGLRGAPVDRPLLDTAVVRSSVQPLTSTEVIRALSTLRIPLIDRALREGDNGARWFTAPIVRENGRGWRADIELPRGAVATDVVDKRVELASALTRPLGCVWPEVDAEAHPGHLTLFVADKDMSKAAPEAWPLLKSGTVDLFQPVPFGSDARGRRVEVTLMFISMVIGSVPRMGKTFAWRLVLLAAALDPRAWVIPFDLKGTGDASSLEPIAYRYRAGDEEEDIAYGLATMREMRTEMRRRTKVIRGLPADICPENKVTPDLANTKSLGLHPIVIGVDECQVWFEHKEHGAEFEEICEDLVKRGPATGITLVLATQRPDAKSLPTGISANAILRFCLKVMGHLENDMVLGSGAHKAGVRATMFSRRDRGIGYLAGEGDDPQITRSYYVDGPMAAAIVARARAARAKAGTLTGHAAGQQVDTAAVRRDTLLEDVAAVIPTDTGKAWTEVVLARLIELRPELYAGMTRDQLTASLKAWGIKSGQTWGTDPDTGKGANRYGFNRDHILAAITKRDRDRDGDAAA